MKLITNVLSQDSDFKELLNDLIKGRYPIACTGLSSIHKSAVISSLFEQTKQKMTVITHDEATAIDLTTQLKEFGINAINFPFRDYCPIEISGYSREYEHKRTDTLSKLLDGAFDVVVFSVDSAIQLTIPPEIMKNSCFFLNEKQELKIIDLCEKLNIAGYVKSDICEGEGQYSLRGGILDIYPVNSKSPVRIEFWGDEIDNISYFDIESQRRTETIKKIEVIPAREILISNDKLTEILNTYISTFKKLNDNHIKHVEKDIEFLQNGISLPLDRYINLIYPERNSILDYISNTVIFICESSNIKERLKSIELQQNEDIEAYLNEGYISKKTADLWLSSWEFYEKINNCIILENFPRTNYEFKCKNIINFNYKRSSSWSGDINVLLEDISYIKEQGGSVVIFAGEQRAASVLNLQLNEKGIKSVFIENPNKIQKGIIVTTGGFSDGFEIPSQRFLLITHKHITGEIKKHRKRLKDAKEIGSLDELRQGDYVVHEAHGIGIFDGINRITNQGVTKDYIKIKYAKSDVLYVPVTQLDLVSKYIGAASENGNIKIHRLGGAEWLKTRKRVKAAVKDMAKQLTALYAKRISVKGYSFSPDTDLQNDFERRFEYDETDDQLRCINEIKNDMERSVPMDRLLCGDVGFGKTEVALRAAFKCISEGKQCALLVPTTILAMQHYNTIIKRFGDMPITVRLLNRFVPQKQQEKIINDLKCGRLDMVVGTHRLISKDVSFKDIGLVIIDEEQRFGVAQKEKLKELYPFVDILTLSATPIPRTLNMAMSGLRDMSSIDEAPSDRQPVQTYVMEFNQGVIIDAINKEIRRGGQVYYLHNRVDTIEICAARLKQKLPNINIGIAHGKMSEEQLTNVWKQLLEHEIDVLVCTTIIETGVDVPNANTLIIEDSDKMGLAQLHQLRGRVGRSPRRAYAYFCFAQNKQLSDIASKRLEAIREYTEFGSGFKIAMRDLEIRGAGSVLGGDQHGNMESVGYDMYLKLLSEAVNEEKGEKVVEDVPCTIDLNVSAHIPENYIESLAARLGIYKRIAAIKNDEDAQDVIDELCDRFGEPPKSVMGLIDISILRNKAAASDIYEISGTPSLATLHIKSIKPEIVAKLTEKFGDRFSVNVKGTPVYNIKLNKGEKMSDLVNKLGKTL